jgi:hypothetical protein
MTVTQRALYYRSSHEDIHKINVDLGSWVMISFLASYKHE